MDGGSYDKDLMQNLDDLDRIIQSRDFGESIMVNAPEFRRTQFAHLDQRIANTLLYMFRQEHPGVMTYGERGRTGGYFFPETHTNTLMAYMSDPAKQMEAQTGVFKMASAAKKKASKLVLDFAGTKVPVNSDSLKDVQAMLNAILEDNATTHESLKSVAASCSKVMKAIKHHDAQAAMANQRAVALEDMVGTLIAQMNQHGIKPKLRIPPVLMSQVAQKPAPVTPTAQVLPFMPKTSKRGEDNPRSKLNESKVRDILRRIKSGVSQTYLAKYYGVSVSTVNNIKMGKSWTHVA
jgi:hypothetical protein